MYRALAGSRALVENVLCLYHDRRYTTIRDTRMSHGQRSADSVRAMCGACHARA
jgi:hypothetical protein